MALNLKINAGFGSTDDYLPLTDAGADELFTGFVPFEWLAAHPNVPLNRREALFVPVSLDSFGELRRLAAFVEQKHVPVSLTFNSPIYPPELYAEILSLMKRCAALGFRDFIVADPGLLMLAVKEPGFRIHLSGEVGEYNRYMVRFFQNLGVSRFILHRRVTPEQLAVLSREAPGAEFEAFLLNERCLYTGAWCLSLHCDELPPLCRTPCRTMDKLSDDPAELSSDPEAFGASGCGICALEKLAAAGATHLKVVGRGAKPSLIVRDVRVLRGLLDGTGDVPACPDACYYPGCRSHYYNKEGKIT